MGIEGVSGGPVDGPSKKRPIDAPYGVADYPEVTPPPSTNPPSKSPAPNIPPSSARTKFAAQTPADTRDVQEIRMTERIKSALINISYRQAMDEVQHAITRENYQLNREQFGLTVNSVLGTKIAKPALQAGYQFGENEVDEIIALNSRHADEVLAFAATNGNFVPTSSQTAAMLERGFNSSEVANGQGRTDHCHEVVAAGVRGGVVLSDADRDKLIARGASSSLDALSVSIERDGPLNQPQRNTLQEQIDRRPDSSIAIRTRPVISIDSSALIAHDLDYPKIDDITLASAVATGDSEALDQVIDAISHDGAKLSPSQLDYVVHAQGTSQSFPRHNSSAAKIVETSFDHGLGFVPGHDQASTWLIADTHAAGRAFSRACSDTPLVPSEQQVQQAFNAPGIDIGEVAHTAITKGGQTLSDDQVTQLASSLRSNGSVRTLFHIVDHGTALSDGARESLEGMHHDATARELLFRNPSRGPVPTVAPDTTRDFSGRY